MARRARGTTHEHSVLCRGDSPRRKCMKARANTLLTTVRGYLLIRVGVLATLTMLLQLAVVCVSAAWATTFTVTNTTDSGPGSLRAAIVAANANAGADE